MTHDCLFNDDLISERSCLKVTVNVSDTIFGFPSLKAKILTWSD